MEAGVRDAFPPPMCVWIVYAFRLGRLRVGLLVSFGWIARKWLFCLYGIVRKCITDFGRGGAYVPARVALQGRIRRSRPCTMRVFFVWKRRCANVRAGTQAPPLRFRLDGLCANG